MQREVSKSMEKSVVINVTKDDHVVVVVVVVVVIVSFCFVFCF